MDKYKKALEEVLKNLRSIDKCSELIDAATDEYIDDSIKIIMQALEQK